MDEDELEYVGFWLRVGASLVDALLTALVCWPFVTLVYGWAYWTDDALVAGPADFLISWVFPAMATIAFWIHWQATPGKMAISARIVDARTGRAASNAQLVGRYFAYFASALPLCVGFIWAACDSRKQGWHDKLSGTVVIRKKPSRKVLFDGQ